MNNKNNLINFFIVVIVIIIIIIYLGSGGQIDPASINKLPSEFKDNKESSMRRHKKLLELINKKEGLKVKLDKRFKIMFSCVRVTLVLLWFGLLFTLYKLNLIKDLEDVLNYSQASLFILFIVNFIAFGTITELKNFIDSIKTKSENWVYGKYVNLEEKLSIDKAEAALLVKDLHK